MNRADYDHEPFDMDRWLESVGDRTVRVTAPTPSILDPARDEPGLHPAEPIVCEGCGEEALLVSEDRTEIGHCPDCGEEHTPFEEA